MLLCDQTKRIVNNTCQWYMQELLFNPRLTNSTLTQIIATFSRSEEHSDPPHQIPLNRGSTYRSQSVVMLSWRVRKHLLSERKLLDFGFNRIRIRIRIKQTNVYIHIRQSPFLTFFVAQFVLILYWRNKRQNNSKTGVVLNFHLKLTGAWIYISPVRHVLKVNKKHKRSY